MPSNKDPKKARKPANRRSRASGASKSVKRPSRSAARTRKKSGKTRQASSLLPFLPLTAVWLVVLVVLSGIIYWGMESRSQRTGPQPDFSSRTVAEKKESDLSPSVSHAGLKESPVHSSPRKPGTAVTSPSPQDLRTPPAIDGTRNRTRHPVSAPETEHIETSGASKTAAAPAQQRVRKPMGRTVPETEDPERTAAPQAPVPPPSPPTGHPSQGMGKETLLAAVHPDVVKKKVPPKPFVPPPDFELKPPVGRVAIVIDDFGQDLDMAKRFLQIPLPITFSVLPHEAHSGEIARIAHSRGREVLLHLPMEPKKYPEVNPGKGALLLSMNEDAIRRLLDEAMDVSPFFSGANNHMGSRFTESEPRMEVVLREVGRRGMFFLDSRTTASSVVVPTAQRLNVPTGRRDIFLDHVQTEAFVRSQLDRLIMRARIKGSAIAIGHPYECTLKVLLEQADRFSREGIAVVPCSALMTGNQDAPGRYGTP